MPKTTSSIHGWRVRVDNRVLQNLKHDLLFLLSSRKNKYHDHSSPIIVLFSARWRCRGFVFRVMMEKLVCRVSFWLRNWIQVGPAYDGNCSHLVVLISIHETAASQCSRQPLAYFFWVSVDQMNGYIMWWNIALVLILQTLNCFQYQSS